MRGRILVCCHVIRFLCKEKQMEAIFKIPGPHCAPGTTAERLLTLHQAAEALGLRYWQLQRATKRGTIPTYAPFGRKLVKLSEVVAYIDSCRQGGDDV